MYAMVDRFSNVITNVNQFYMAGLMTMPMIIIELLIMRAMYMNQKLNSIIMGICILVSIGFYLGVRKQVAVSDRQFLRSMIPHHSGAILMCNEADLKDPEIKKLCEQIIESQKKEIEERKSRLELLKTKGDEKEKVLLSQQIIMV
jgi:uncharacterized protein (DUF305 family)